jgi:7-cyano-7-deazaguanine reductase
VPFGSQRRALASVVEQRLPAGFVGGQAQTLFAPLPFVGIKLIQPRLQAHARLAQMRQLGFQAADFAVRRIHFALRRVQGVGSRKMRFARLLDARLDLAQLRGGGFDAIDGFLDLAGQRLRLVARGVTFFQPEQRLLVRQARMQFAIRARHLGLRLQAGNLRAEFVANILNARQILPRVFQPMLGFLAPFLVFGDAGGFFEEEAQLVRLGLDDARNHALADDRVGARAQAGTEEQIDHVAAADVQIVDVVARIAFAVEHPLDGDFAVLRPLPGGAALGVVEEQLDAGAAHRLAVAGALEDHVLDRFATQFGSLRFAQHPAHGVDDVRLAAAVRPDHAGQLAGKQHGGRLDEGLETGDLEFGETHLEWKAGTGIRTAAEKASVDYNGAPGDPGASRFTDTDSRIRRKLKSRRWRDGVNIIADRRKTAKKDREISAMPSQPTKTLETFANPAAHRDYLIHMEIPEFTCLCPKTGQPDFAVLTLDYVPDKRCVELKSLKLYVWSFRDEGHFHEDVTNRMLDDLVNALKPRFMRLTARFYVRGGIFTNVVAEHRKKGWRPPEKVDLVDFPGQSNIRG